MELGSRLHNCRLQVQLECAQRLQEKLQRVKSVQVLPAQSPRPWVWVAGANQPYPGIQIFPLERHRFSVNSEKVKNREHDKKDTVLLEEDKQQQVQCASRTREPCGSQRRQPPAAGGRLGGERNAGAQKEAGNPNAGPWGQKNPWVPTGP